MKKSVLTGLFMIFAALAVRAQAPGPIASLPDDSFPLIGELEWKDGFPRQLALLQDVPGAELVNRRFQEFRPEITAERLYKITLPPGFDAASAEQRGDLFVRIANIFGNPREQEKYLYFSYNRDREIPLIEEAYICDSKGKKQSPLTYTRSSLPGSYDYFQYIDEANFSGVVMRVNMQLSDDYVYVRSENSQGLRYGIIPLIPKEEMRSDNFIFLKDGALFAYSLTQLKEDVKIKRVGPYTIKPFGLFGKRMDVAADWLQGELF